MSSLKILQYPHPALRAKAAAVSIFDDALRQTIQQMFELMYSTHGCGLAATQVGLGLRLFIMDLSKDRSAPFCFINPEIVTTQAASFSEEGCLSFPGIYTKILRAQSVTIRFQDEFGKNHEQNFEDLGAHCIQHEIEHLEGILFIDHLSKLKRMIFLKKLEKQQRIAS